MVLGVKGLVVGLDRGQDPDVSDVDTVFITTDYLCPSCCKLGIGLIRPWRPQLRLVKFSLFGSNLHV